jgi:hypothetical protein
MRQLIPPILFMLSAGIYFNDKQKRNVVIVGVAGALAVVATYFTIEQLIDRIVSHLQNKDKAYASGEAFDYPQFFIRWRQQIQY